MLRDSIWILTPNRSAPYESAALPTSVNHNARNFVSHGPEGPPTLRCDRWT
jgi:hypothetical protein